MSQADRDEWFRAAGMALRGIPSDLLARGAAHARIVADHPSKIVPAIMREVEQAWAGRKRSYAPVAAPAERLPAPTYFTPAQALSISREFGLENLGKRSDIAVKPEPVIALNTGPARAPTAAETAAMLADAKARYPAAYAPPASAIEQSEFSDLDDELRRYG